MNRGLLDYIFLGMLLTCLTFTTIAIPTALYQSKVGASCITLWGNKDSCLEAQVSVSTMDGFICNELKDNLVDARVFAMFSMFAAISGPVLWTIAHCLDVETLHAVTFTTVVAQTFLSMMVFILESATFNQRLCNMPSLRDTDLYKYGPSFILSVFAFLVGMAYTVLYVFTKVRAVQGCIGCVTRTCYLMCEGESESAADKNIATGTVTSTEPVSESGTTVPKATDESD